MSAATLTLGNGAATAQAGVQAGGAIAAALAPAVAIPIIGAGVAAVGLAIGLLANRKGPKQKIATTKIVEKYEPLMEQNLQAYLNGPRTRSSQAYAANNHAKLWAMLEAECGAPEMGEPGQRCINERKRGGVAPWCPTATGCDLFARYLDPILNDPDVKDDPVSDLVSNVIPGIDRETLDLVAQWGVPLLIIAVGLLL